MTLYEGRVGSDYEVLTTHIEKSGAASGSVGTTDGIRIELFKP